MTFIVDIVSEDSFYENLTLGLTKLLAKVPHVRDLELEKKLPCDRMLLTSWEQRHCCTLPEDMRQFYLSTDGFRLIWNYASGDEILPIGNMKINSISELRRLAGVKNSGDPDSPNLLDIEICSQAEDRAHSSRHKPNFGVKCKIFEMDSCQGNGKVCLVYLDKTNNESDLKREDPKIWLLDRCFDWHFLADSFSQYFRMMLVHQGLPQWHFRFTSMSITPWAENLFLLIAPHLLLPENNTYVAGIDWTEVPHNHIDPSIFKIRAKNSKKNIDSGNKAIIAKK